MCSTTEYLTITIGRGRRVGYRRLKKYIDTPLLKNIRWHEELHRRIYSAFGIRCIIFTYITIPRGTNVYLNGYCAILRCESWMRSIAANVIQVMFEMVHRLLFFGLQAFEDISRTINTYMYSIGLFNRRVDETRRLCFQYMLDDRDDLAIQTARMKSFLKRRSIEER